MRLYQDVQDQAVLINCPPQLLPLAIDFQKYLVEMPFVPRPGTAPPQVIGKGLAEFLASLADRFVGHADPPDGHHLLDVAVTEAEAKIEPHTVTDDLSGEAVATVQCGGRVHGRCMHHQHACASTHCYLDNTLGDLPN